jgi:hypothetical protein
MLEPIINTIEVPCGQEQAFKVFTTEMHAWWPLDKRSMSLRSTGKPPKSLNVDPKLGGRIVEIDAEDTEHHWGTFRAFDPSSGLSMDMHMGLPAENASTVAVTFEAIGKDRTRVELTHSNWEAFGDMAEMMRNGYGSGWVLIFEGGFAAACQSVAAE